MTSPAVVLATRDRPLLLDRCLAALAAQSLLPSEVVVVDDASVTEIAPVLGRWGSRLTLRSLRTQTSVGPGRARNLGWRSAGAEFVAFTDDDCRPTPGWLAALAAAAAPNRVLVGPAWCDPADGELRSVLDRVMEVHCDDRRFSTCNALYPRASLEALGGFDDAFDLYGEDTDLGLRALEHGATAVFVADAVVLHAVHRSGWRAAVRDRARMAEMARLVRRHPQIRRSMHGRVFVRRSHARALAAAAGMVGAAVTPAAALLPVLWAREAVHRVPPAARGRRRLPLQLARLAVLDGLEVAACAYGSARHRCLVL